jgi:protein ImuB
VGDLELIAVEVQALEEHSFSLLPDPKQTGESLTLVLERIAARLGPQRVLRPLLLEDHRLEWQVHWQDASQPAPSHCVVPLDLPQPSFTLAQPLRLSVKSDQPQYQGLLHLLSGPHRVEGGWWDRVTPASTSRTVVRDYWVALSAHAGVLWIYQTRLARDRSAWFLHGVFA